MFASKVFRWVRTSVFSSVATITLTASAAAQAATTWIDVKTPSEDTRNYVPGDLGMVDVPLQRAGVQWLRVFYTTQGFLDESGPAPVLFPGNLRPVALRLPLPDFSPYDGSAWPQGVPQEWETEDAVSKWNDVLGGDSDPPFGKTTSLQGIASRNGTVFVSGLARWVKPPPSPAGNTEGWNGLSMVAGTADPGSAFRGSASEIWSYGGTADVEASPEGVGVAVTGTGSEFVLVANYCGHDAAGFLHVQDITNMAPPDPSAWYDVDLFDYLGDYTATAPAGPLGLEVAKSKFYNPPDFRGNKLRQIHVVTVKSGLPNGGRVLLFATLNLDPVEVFTVQTFPGLPVFGEPVGLGDPLDDDGDFDDGHYDYLAIVDITDMAGNPGPGEWGYDAESEWSARTRFLRLPPDVPAGWTPDSGPPAEGYDWSIVVVEKPGDPSTTASKRNLGSGTPSSITSHPDGTWVYVVAIDQGGAADGGLHVPHLYAVDLSAGDFTDQAFLNGYSDNVVRKRFNKVVTHSFGGAIGWKLVASQMGMPTVPGADGENFYDPVHHTRLIAVDNEDLSNRTRLYVGANGQAAFTTNPPSAGAVFSFDLPSATPGAPNWISTFPLPKKTTEPGDPFYEIRGLVVVPRDTTWLGSQPGDLARNVLLVTGLDTGTGLLTGFIQDRLFVRQDI